MDLWLIIVIVAASVITYLVVAGILAGLLKFTEKYSYGEDEQAMVIFWPFILVMGIVAGLCFGIAYPFYYLYKMSERLTTKLIEKRQSKQA